jgi:DNA modification methylase
MKTRLPSLDQVYEGDATKVLPSWPSRLAHALITDPPYGNDTAYSSKRVRIAGDEHPLVGLAGLAASYRLLKPDAIAFVFCGAQHLALTEHFISRYTAFRIKEVLCWNKGSAGFGYTFRRSFENILVLTKGNPTFKVKGMPTVLNYGRTLKREHPHAKPLPLLQYLIEAATIPGETVLDPFAGSGSTLVAAKSLDRRFIGVEIDERYAAVAHRRIKDERAA